MPHHTPKAPYVFPQPFSPPVPGRFRVPLGHQRRPLSPRPLTPQANRFYAPFLGGSRATRGSRAPQAHPATVVLDPATGEHGLAASGHRPVASRHARPRRPRPRDHSRNLGLDGSPLGQEPPHGTGPRPGPPLPPRSPVARPRHAGARRRPGDSRHRFRTRPPEDRSRHP